MNKRKALFLLALAAQQDSPALLVDAFGSTLFQEQAAQQTKAPAIQPGIEIELPDFDELFSRIQQTSPLAKLAFNGGGGEVNGKRGLAALESMPASEDFEWKSVENNRDRLVHDLQKIEKFQGLNAPLLRFRCNLKGPVLPHLFTSFLTTNEFRSKWDESLADICENYPVEDLDAVNMALGFGKYGKCTKLGVGYCTTKPVFGVDSREQLTMCGIQELDNGSSIIWGTEMAETWHDHLLPDDEMRRTRAKSHLFATTLIPTGRDSFDVEYVMQLEFGGKMPNFLTTPIVIDSVKTMFKVVGGYFGGGEGSELDQYLQELAINKATLDEHRSLLMTP